MKTYTLSQQKTDQIIDEIQTLGYSESEARDFLNTYLDDGGFACYLKWPHEFSMFADTRTVLDVFLKQGIGYVPSARSRAV